MRKLLKAHDGSAQASVVPIGAKPVAALPESGRTTAPDPNPGPRAPVQSARAPSGSDSPIAATGRLHSGGEISLQASAKEDEQHSQAARRCRELETIVAELREASIRAAEEADAREEAAYERGITEGREAAGRDEEKRCEILAEAAGLMRQDLAENLVSTEQLAVELAQASVAKILGASEDRSQQVCATLQHHISGLNRELILSIQVSPQDFGSAEQLASLKERCLAVPVEASDELSGGECRAILKLGTLDLGLPGQWQRLCEFFARLTDDEAQP